MIDVVRLLVLESIKNGVVVGVIAPVIDPASVLRSRTTKLKYKSFAYEKPKDNIKPSAFDAADAIDANIGIVCAPYANFAIAANTLNVALAVLTTANVYESTADVLPEVGAEPPCQRTVVA